MDAPDNYQTTYDSKTKILVFYTLNMESILTYLVEQKPLHKFAVILLIFINDNFGSRMYVDSGLCHVENKNIDTFSESIIDKLVA